MAAEPWYPVGRERRVPRDIRPFLLGNAKMREVFMEHHADLLDAALLAGAQGAHPAGHIQDVFPYTESLPLQRTTQAACPAFTANPRLINP